MIEVDYELLFDAGRQWREQADQLTGSVRAFERASVAGVHPEVQAEVKAFLATWVAITQVASTAAEEMDDKITAACYAVQNHDENSRREFSEWLVS